MDVHLFWDNSNIWLVGSKVCTAREPGSERYFRIQFDNLYDFAVDKRKVASGFVGGSIPPNSDPLWSHVDSLGVHLVRQERGSVTGKEVAVDEAIQLAMTHAMLDAPTPGTMVLLTGDGAGYKDGKGFIMELERAQKRGWAIEVVSWDAGVNPRLRKFAETHGKYRSLEPVYEKVTFIEQKRRSLPL